MMAGTRRGESNSWQPRLFGHKSDAQGVDALFAYHLDYSASKRQFAISYEFERLINIEYDVQAVKFALRSV